MMSIKSPISLLQELAVKERYLPTYTFIGHKYDETNLLFIYQVTCKDISTKGTGRSKKEAKQNAANNMLLLLKNNEIQVPDISSSTDISSIKNNATSAVETSMETTLITKPSLIFVNYVGMLQEFCQRQGLNHVSYEYIGETGIQHNKIFTVEAKIDSLRKQGRAHCKKQAKQEAAKLVWNVLNESMQTNIEQQSTADPNRTFNNNGLQKLGIQVKQTELNHLNMTKLQSLIIEHVKRNKKTMQNNLIKDCHVIFKETYSNQISSSMKEHMRMICDNQNENNQRDLIQLIEDIKSILKIELQQFNFHSVENNVICLRLMSIPKITQFGSGKTEDEAKLHAMYNIIKTMLILLN